MTRLEKELKGQLGEYWKADAEKRLAHARAEYEAGEITVDENGVARNCIGRPLMSDMAEVLTLARIKFSLEATKQAREEYVMKEVAQYIEKNYQPSTEEKAEMRNAFGPGTTVVDVISGKKVKL